ncbi:ferrous iron transport protein B [Actinotalea fermentans]|uniref:Ferrous iron transport protein B n=1 Tax=Actinotalea fermentans TaxID=43671 RepID=A0A511YWS0_9CELL|nr:ferrous iron transport protein B [Actinotalea fermentans]KGM16200.1 iron transporter FeoB [Actinotalea fermentans ATCC 43279 = JCM 9966 = DSM 3133]GEN79576.1 ferrous iron transport protein B [Actinotalea fermentans]
MTTTCHDAGGGTLPADVAAVLLVGNPNVGKSTLFNTLTGARQSVMNAPGTTVELHLGTWRAADLALVDLPGTYSLVPRTPDEMVVRDTLASRGDAAVLVVVDATALSRSLYLLAQAGAQRPVAVAVTMLDVARTQGHAPDLDRLAAILDVPVVAVDPRSGTGLDALADAVRAARPLADVPDTAGLAPLEAADRLFGWVDDVVTRLDPPAPAPRTRSDRVDRALLNPWFGGPVFLAAMWALFELTTTVATPVMDLVDGWVGALADVTRGALGGAPAWVSGLLVDGVLVGVGTVLTFLPLLAIIYVALALLEDSGYLARAAVLADRLMRVIGLDGRAMLPIVIGFGCNVPAIAATQTLPTSRQRLLTGILVPWTTCAARLPVYVLLAGVFFPQDAGTAIFAMYVLSLVLVVVGGLVLRRTLFRDVRKDPLLIVLPTYQRPHLRGIARSVWGRVQGFALKAGGIIVVTLTAVWVLMAVPVGGADAQPGPGVPVEDSLYGAVAQTISPVFAPAGFDDWHFSAALVTGFVAKEVAVGALAQSYAVADDSAAGLGEHLRATLEASSGGHAAAAALAFMVFVLAYTPCLATASEQWRRFGGAWTVRMVGIQLAVAWLVAVAVFQVGSRLGGLG